MKQCKICGTLVQIDSNTCPSCGNHSFFVVDVRICPICGKVNSLSSSFCEQCGNHFISAKSEMKRPAATNFPSNYYREKPQRELNEERFNRQKPEEDDFEIEKTFLKTAGSDLEQKYNTDKIYKDFIALKPDIKEKEGYSEYSYYIKGDSDKPPVVILPKFVKASGKNIMVNIVVGQKEKENELQEVKPVISAQTKPQEKIPEDNGEFKPFSALEEIATPIPAEIKTDTAEIGKVLEKTDVPQPAQEKENGKLKEKLLKDLNIKSDKKSPKPQKAKKEKKAKTKIKFKSILTSAVLIIIAFCVLACFTMVFYTDDTDAGKAAGISAVVQFFNNMLKTEIVLPFAFNNGYNAFWTLHSGGQYINYAYIVPTIFSVNAILFVFAIIINLFAIRQKMWAKVILVFISILALICELLIVVALFVIFNAGIKTLGVGLILTIVLSVVYFITLLLAYKPVKD